MSSMDRISQETLIERFVRADLDLRGDVAAVVLNELDRLAAPSNSLVMWTVHRLRAGEAVPDTAAVQRAEACLGGWADLDDAVPLVENDERDSLYRDGHGDAIVRLRAEGVEAPAARSARVDLRSASTLTT